ncbi:MAG: hypothetical protein ACYDAE_17855 [Steroidobacteraceae bacterium]
MSKSARRAIHGMHGVAHGRSQGTNALTPAKAPGVTCNHGPVQLPDPYKPPSSALQVKFIHGSQENFCELWENNQRVGKALWVVRRRSPTITDHLYRVGDTLDWGMVDRKWLPALGFREGENSLFTSVLFWLIGIESVGEFQVLRTITQITPGAGTYWRGEVVVAKYLSVAGELIPFPNTVERFGNFAVELIWRRTAAQLYRLGKMLDAFGDVFEEVVLALITDGASELKVTKTAEKYVAAVVWRRAMRWLRPKFLVFVKAYVEGFLRELASQIAKHVMLEVRKEIAAKRVGGPQAAGQAATEVTVEHLAWMQARGKLEEESKKEQFDLIKCNEKGVEKALDKVWILFSSIGVKAETALGKVLSQEFFPTFRKVIFDEGIYAAIRSKGGNVIAKKIDEALAKCVSEAVTALVRAGGGKVTQGELEDKVAELTLDNLSPETLSQYIDKNFDGWAKSATKMAEDGFVKMVGQTLKESGSSE